jgi:hypothetical protein
MFIPSLDAMQRLGHVPEATNTRNNRGVVFYTVRVVTEGRVWVCLYVLLSLLGNSSVNTFPRPQTILEGVVFYAVPVVSKESRLQISTELLAYKRLELGGGQAYDRSSD